MRFRPFGIAIAFCIATASLYAQSNNYYEQRWQKIDSLLKKEGLTRSALQLLDEVYATAKKEGSSANAIRALLISSALRQTVTDDISATYIKEIESAAAGMPAPANSILLHMAAQQYELYYQAHRYYIDGRSETVAFEKNDITTWSGGDFYEKIKALYLQSVKDTLALQNASVMNYEQLFWGSDVRNLRPTMFDVLAHRVIEFLNGSNLFNIKSDNELIEKLFQQLIRFHALDKDPAALIDVKMIQLQMVYEDNNSAEKDSLFESALINLAEKYKGQPGAGRVWFVLANLYSTKAAQFHPLYNPVNQYDYVKAKKICEELAAQKDSTMYRDLALRLLHEIDNPELSFKAEQVNEAGKPFRMLATFRNISQFKVRIVRVNQGMIDSRAEYQWNSWYNVLQQPVTRVYTQRLPATNDHQKHAVEIKISALPPGQYALIASYGQRFADGSDSMSLQFFQVSNLACINNGKDVFVVDRENGRPVAGAAVRMWKMRRGGVYYPGPPATLTNAKGYCQLPNYVTDASSIALEVVTPNDKLFVTDRNSLATERDDDATMGRTEYEEDNRTTDFFTDRSIYRPGQVVYFKGISMTTDLKTKKTKLITGKKLKIFLKDANDEVVDSLIATTNQFGSVTGKFKLPENKLNGRFSLDEEKGTAWLSVEEYKRPRFSVSCDPVAGSYRLGDSVTVTGLAKSFAGNSIDGAMVKYRITRRSDFRDLNWYWQLAYGSKPTSEITHGQTTTRANGTFSITFKALPDEKIKKDLDPFFIYEITADVTDLNGETRSAETSVKASYKALNLDVSAPGHLNVKDLSGITITTTNMAGQFQRSLVNVTMRRLAAPSRVIRERYWDQPDLYLFSKEEYLKYFPFDEYSNETAKFSWERLDKAYERSDSTMKDGHFIIDGKKISAGWYVIEVSTVDKYGEPVKAIQYIELRGNDSNAVNPQYDWNLVNNATALPGDTVTITTGTSTDVYLIRCIDRGDKSFQHSFASLNNEKKSFRIPVRESDRGGIGYKQFFVKHNRIFVSTANISVDWQKDLHISFETFRDKTLPGSQEKWKVKISGSKKEKLLAEMLTSMYDASLDEFKPHDWLKPAVWPRKSLEAEWEGVDEFEYQASVETPQLRRRESRFIYADYDRLYAGLMTIRNVDGSYRDMVGYFEINQVIGQPRTMQVVDWTMDPDGSKGITKDTVISNDAAIAYRSVNITYNADGKPRIVVNDEKKPAVAIRRNFNETAFFFPQLYTDSSGNIEFSFTMPESVTRWKWMMLAHTKDLSFGYNDTSVITQKELMVQPNLPRFVREGDNMSIVSKVANTGANSISGEMELQLLDAVTNEPVNTLFGNEQLSRAFTVPAGQSAPVAFNVKIPYNFTHPLSIRFVARSGSMSDGEENAIPVLSNRMMVTETMPLDMRGSGTKNFTFNKLLASDSSKTLSHHSVTLEFTGNPAWYAVQSLPYLMEYPYECAEQTWNRLYANALAATIIDKAPRIKEIFKKWKDDSTALLSKLQKNEELKLVLLQETPWVLEAQNEAEQHKRMALLFDMAKMGGQIHSTLQKLIQLQANSGGFAWFKGDEESEYITQYIVSGIGHLQKLGGWPAAEQQTIAWIATRAIGYLDSKMDEHYSNLLKSKADTTKDLLSYSEVQYLYARSFFRTIHAKDSTAFRFFMRQAQKFWLQQSNYMQGMIALALYRNGDQQTAERILRSLKENAIINEERGMYWKGMEGGYYWYESPIEIQSLMIEAFADITKDTATVAALKTWLLKHKQTNNWSTTRATAEACYALLLQGTNWLSAEPVIQIKLGDKTVNSTEQKTEAGTGYFKKAFSGKEVNSSMGNISVSVTNSTQPSWGAVYWQYFENLEKVTSAATPLSLTKKLFVQDNAVLKPVQGNLKVGDKVIVRIELRVDRGMEYVHMKDMRASALEPVNVLSSFKWQDGLGYYESTKDASTNFFFSYLPKGTYVFEYPLLVTHTGTFSNGITTIQCMYAPEFSSHSEGVKINVE